MIIECYNCGDMFEHININCPRCGIENIGEEVAGDGIEESCLTCFKFKAGEIIECEYFAKKFERDEISIDEPSTFKCEGGYVGRQ